jgi:3',5'-cyclic AMP phosphodiesterase CpdA
LALLSLAVFALAQAATAVHDERTLNVAFITDLHLGEHCNGDLSLEGCKSVRNFHDAVAHLPEISSKRFPLDGVFVSGDITSSALREQFEKAREVLDDVQVPWWPLLGNHDAWSYEKHSDGSFTQTDTPTGDQEFAAAFGDVLSGTVDTEPTAKHWPTKPCKNGNYGYDSWFQNFEVTFEKMPDLTFLALDWVSRKNALPEPGVGPEVELHDFECGSFPW